MEWGYAWEAGPFKQMDVLGLDFLREGFARLGLDDAARCSTQAKDGASIARRATAGVRSTFDGDVRAGAAGARPDLARLAARRARAPCSKRSKDANLLDLGDGVLLLEFRSKMNTLGEGVLAMLRDGARARRAAASYDGLVIGNDDPRTFTRRRGSRRRGRGRCRPATGRGSTRWCATSRKARSVVRRAPFPVVAAPFGLTLGGGCEYALHCDRVQAHAELYMGLVEVGVGLIPAGGGTKELLFRFTRQLAPYDEADPFEGVKRAFKLIAMATTSTSALEARNARVPARGRSHHDEPRPAARRREGARARSRAGLRRAAAAHDHARSARRRSATCSTPCGRCAKAGRSPTTRCASRASSRTCSAAATARRATVTEQDILDLEREAFLRLLGTKETQERIAAHAQDGQAAEELTVDSVRPDAELERTPSGVP